MSWKKSFYEAVTRYIFGLGGKLSHIFLNDIARKLQAIFHHTEYFFLPSIILAQVRIAGNILSLLPNPADSTVYLFSHRFRKRTESIEVDFLNTTKLAVFSMTFGSGIMFVTMNLGLNPGQASNPSMGK